MPIGNGVGLNWPKYFGLGTPIAFGSMSSRKRRRMSSIGIPVSGSGSSKRRSISAGVAGGVTRRVSSAAAWSLMICGTAWPSILCCSTKSSFIVYASRAKLIMQTELQRFEHSLRANGHAFGVELSADGLARLGTYYSLLTHWNDRLHLVAPCAPEE